MGKFHDALKKLNAEHLNFFRRSQDYGNLMYDTYPSAMRIIMELDKDHPFWEFVETEEGVDREWFMTSKDAYGLHSQHNKLNYLLGKYVHVTVFKNEIHAYMKLSIPKLYELFKIHNI